jgi:selenocysteine lyase/cysteine desulfurase
VTGIENPISEIAILAHQHGAYILVDGAQQAAHQRVSYQFKNELESIDFYVFSGHKVYSPGAPGVLIANRQIIIDLPGADLGGGSVEHVSHYESIQTSEFPDREQSGTPNIIGAYQLAKVFETLDSDENTDDGSTAELMHTLLQGIEQRPNLRLYGDASLARTGAVSINHSYIEHGLLSAILNDYFAIAVRNECFCAHPYVSEMLKTELWAIDLDDIPLPEQEAYINRYRGMVRVSLSRYNTSEDLELLFSALDSIEKEIDRYRQHYEVQTDGSFIHKDFKLDWQSYLL